MSKTALVTTEKKQTKPILIIDKLGKLGKELALKLRSEFLVVLVSKDEVVSEENIIFIPFQKKVPSIPDNKYSNVILVADEKSSWDFVKSILKKAKKDSSLFSVVLNHEYYQEKFMKNLIKFYEKSKVLIIGDVFFENYIYFPKSEFGELIYKAKALGKLEIEGDGSSEQSPVYLDDVIDAILESIFVEEKNEIFYLFPKSKTTLLSIALALKKKYPNLHLDFIRPIGKRKKNINFPAGGKYMLYDPYNFNENIKKINIDKVSIDNFEQKNKKKKTYGFNFLPLFVFLFSLLLLPILVNVFFTLLGNGFLMAANKNLYFDKTLYLSSKSFNIADSTLPVLDKELNFFKLVNVSNYFDKQSNLRRAENQALFSLGDSINIFKDLQNSRSQTSFSKMVIEAKNSYFYYETLKQENRISTSLQSYQNFFKILSETVDYWSSILGFEGEKNYLVLFQNNTNLRPGGGFINSYGILTLSNGKISEFKISSLEHADKNLNSHVEPPFAIRRYLPSVNWYLKDSNFNLDFSRGAIASSVFLNTETHQAVDGVIGLDLDFTKEMLKITGPVKVINYNKTVNSQNLLQSASENPNNDFLTSFYKYFVLKLSNQKNIEYPKLLNILSKSLLEKHLIVAFNNKYLQAGFSVNDFSSSLLDFRNKENTLNDFIGINEANLGSNGVNHFIKRRISQVITVGKSGGVSEKLTINIKNDSSTLFYKNYLRIALPLNSLLSSVIIDGKGQKTISAIVDPTIYENKKFLQPAGLEIEKYIQGQNTIYGFLININPSQQTSIEINYDISQKVNFSNGNFDYNLRVFKQPGTDVLPFNFSIVLPSNTQIIKGEQGSFELTGDRDFNLTLSSR